MSKSQRDKVAWEHVEYPVKHLIGESMSVTRPHACGVANMCGFVCGYAAVCLLRPLWTACGATQAGCGVELAVKGYRSATSTHASISN